MEKDLINIGMSELLDTINSGVAVYGVVNDGASGDDYRIVFFNRFALEHEGKTQEEIAGKSLKDLRPNIDDYGLIQVFRTVWQTGVPALFPATAYTDDKFANWYENRVFRLSPDSIVSVYDDVTARHTAEIELRRSEAKLRSYIDYAPDGFFIADSTGHYLDVNAAASLITGYSREELLQMSIPDLIPPDHLKESLGHFQRVRREGVSEGVTCFRMKSGEMRFWNVKAVRLSEDSLMAFTHDVTDTVRIRESLRTNEERFKLAEKIGMVGSWEYDVLSGEFWGSDGAKVIYGFPLDTARFTPEEVESRIPERERVHRALIDLIEKDLPYNLEFEIIPSDTHRRKTITSIAELLRDEAGKPLKVTGMIQDVTARVEAERAVKASEEKYRTLFCSMRDALFITDDKRHLLDCNQALLDIFETDRDKVIGRDVRFFYTTDDEYIHVGEYLKEIPDSGGEPLITARFVRSGGEEFTGEMSIFSRRDSNGEHCGFTGIIKDISRREHLEAQLRQSQKMEAIGQLAGGIAHDFNNLLTIINGYSYMLLESIGRDQAGHNELQEIKKAGHRAASLTRQLLAFSRKQMLKPEIIDINGRILETKTMLERLIGEHISIETLLSEGPVPVLVDPGQFDQIVFNLVVNARDAMPRGGRLLLKTERLVLDEEESRKMGLICSGNLAVFTVSDTGNGMDEHTLGHIFEPFFTTKGTGKGTGMGLPTVFGVVRQSGGDISVTSRKGIGSSFTVYLPLADSMERTSDAAEELPYPTSHGETILLVEDEPSVSELIRTALEYAGFRVFTASCGDEAISLAAKKDFSIGLLLTDVLMPGMSGRELADIILQKYPELPVCFMSGYTDHTVEQLGFLDGNAHFIQKPFLPSELVKKIRDILDSR